MYDDIQYFTIENSGYFSSNSKKNGLDDTSMKSI